MNLRVGVGVLIADPGERKQGFATDALALLLEYCFQTLNVHQVYCNITVDNDPSLKLFQNHGFKIIGTKKDWLRNGKGWVDEYMLQLIRE